ncbi:hypothetical protein KL937_003144 [Ogataea polymorpha]|uniref:PX domain-containing protein n=1 Tax=Ogataea polymorpha TaxID=460523 RepID=A0A9P8TGI1_9ASCO|nr:hypothetical protein KL937_003144 [Ogataea polymorpha]KAG7892447.1 hypothetical protein KL908_003399 [Ogataea polymorpha]KAG7916045.1 hypothetical protein KL927_003510 [Ogataea polymorpha]KAG7934991.1 hypothetical protein KL904_003323 [Ogataea polymorpha]KAH3677929.1 hypothetical protein OGATHE_000583 [Ogataea polymorpha]
MNHFEEENVWNDDATPGAGHSVSVLFSPDDNPYASELTGADMDEVDFRTESNIYNELTDTMRSVHIGKEELEETAQRTESGDEPQPAQGPIEDAIDETEQAKQKNKQLLSSLVAGEEENSTWAQSILSDTPNANERLFTAGNEGPLDGVLDFDAPQSPPKISDDQPRPEPVTSPNKKTRVFRPRRARRKSADTANACDPLSTRTEESQTESVESRKENLIAAVDKPLFDIKRGASPVKPSIKTPATPEPADHFEIIVGDPIKVGELTNAHIVYSITTKTKSSLLKSETTTVTRRYRDFLWLYNQLMNNHPGYIIPPPPEKQAYGRFDEKFIENRRLALEKMLNKIARVSVFQKDYDFIVFLQSERFAAESKEREFLYYHGGSSGDDQSISAGDDGANDFSASSIINTATGGSNGGFLSSLISISTPKYVENDQFIIEKQNYIESLDQQLRSLSRTLDMIVEKREDVITSMNELILIIQELADLEVNAELSELFANYEELQSKVKELLERTNLQQILTLGTTIDEYIRTIGSIRNCFEMRFKLCTNIVNLQSQHSKKQKNLIKFKSKNHNQFDKIKKYEDELANMENTIARQEEFKAEFNKNFKRELDKFEFEKVDEFRSTIEIYWEGLIESQKELIELWESFYDKCNFQDE